MSLATIKRLHAHYVATEQKERAAEMAARLPKAMPKVESKKK